MAVSKLRSLTLGAPTKGRTKLVTITLGGESSEVEVRAPSLRQQELAARQAMDKEGKVQAHKSVALMLIACAWDIEEDAPVFTHKDLDTIMGFGTTGWVGQLMDAIKSITVPPKDKAKEEEESFGETSSG